MGEQPETSVRRGAAGTIAAALPVALAVGVLGTIYGTMSAPLLGAGLAIASSAVIFSGAAQFSMAGLLLAGGKPLAVLLTVLTLNLRHLLLGSLLRPRVQAGPARRAVLSWFLIDESAGLALASGERVESTLLVSGILLYLAWVGGTAVGVLAGSLAGLRAVADAVFPVLFIGLAAMSATGRDLAVRAVVAALLTIGLATAWPEGRGLAPVVAAMAVSLPGGRGSS